MKIHVLSDLHFEFAPFSPPITDADVVVLAGDINLGTRGVEWAKNAFADKPVVYVAGNHEFYKHHWVKLLVDLRGAATGSNVHFLEDETLVIDGVRFLGCTLWTDFALFGDEQRHSAMLSAELRMTDYKKIRAPRVKPGFQDDYSKLKPIQTVERFRRSKTFLEKNLDTAFDGPTVVVTHHLPSRKSLPLRYSYSLTSAAYASDLTELIWGRSPKMWIHGHAHVSCDYTERLTRIVSNPRGYRLSNRCFENSRFDPSMVVAI
jgi:Icc-related predicted phosphoesterase